MHSVNDQYFIFTKLIKGKFNVFYYVLFHVNFATNVIEVNFHGIRRTLLIV